MKTIFNNFTHYEINAEIKPTNSSQRNSKINIDLFPKDKKQFKFDDTEYTINVTKINSNPVNMLFKLKFSSYMAFMCDLNSERIFLQNFVERKKYFDLNSNDADFYIDPFVSPSKKDLQTSVSSEIRNSVNKIKNLFEVPNNFPNQMNKNSLDSYGFQTTTNSNGVDSNIVDYTIPKNILNSSDLSDLKKFELNQNAFTNAKKILREVYIPKAFLQFDEDDENDFFNPKFMKKNINKGLSFVNMLKNSNNNNKSFFDNFNFFKSNINQFILNNI